MGPRAAFLALTLSTAGIPAPASPPSTSAGAPARTSPDAQIAAGNERLRTSAARLRAASRTAETQPGSAAGQNDLKAALGAVEASYEYLIGIFSKLNASDDRRQLELLRRQLDELRKQKQALLSKMTGHAASSGEWRPLLKGLAALSDEALAAAVARPARGPTPTPAR